jgi:trigger factor
VKATVEPLEGNKVKLSVAVDEDEFERAIDTAFRKIAREVRIPGFRPGKAPRKVLEARIGADAARHQALHDSIPEYYAEAVRTHDVDVIAAPEIDITDGEETGGVAFDAVVEVRPVVTVPGYASLQVTIPSPEPSDDDVDAQLETMRTQFAELAVVERPAAEGDYVTVDIAGSQDGEPLEGLTADDYLYPLGSGAIVPELDDELTGAKPGDILEFDAAYPGTDDTEGEAPSPLRFRVLVKEVKAQVLPDLDDEFAAEASEFDTLEELRDDLRRRMGGVRRVQAQMALREKASEALAELVDEELPHALIDAELNDRLQDLALRLQAQGITLEQWLAATGKGQEELIGELRQTAAVAAKVDLALRAVAEAQGIEVDDDDLAAEYDALAERVDSTPAKVRQQLERADQVPAIRSDLKKRKALEWLLDAVTIVDEEGRTIDRSDLELPTDTDADAEGDEPAGPGDRVEQPEASDASAPPEEEDA